MTLRGRKHTSHLICGYNNVPLQQGACMIICTHPLPPPPILYAPIGMVEHTYMSNHIDGVINIANVKIVVKVCNRNSQINFKLDQV